MNKQTLIILNCQYDYIKGAVAVTNAEKAISNIISYILYLHKNGLLDKVIFAIDWHQVNHCSFEVNGGHLPIHCVQHSKGASIDESLFDVVMETHTPYDIILRGDDASVDMISAFSIRPFKDCLFDNHHAVDVDENSTIVVCGISTNNCLKETTLDLIELDPKILLAGVALDEDPKEFSDFLKGFKIDTY